MMQVYMVTMCYKYWKEIMYMKKADNFPSTINYNSLKYIVHFSARLNQRRDSITGCYAAVMSYTLQWAA